MELCFVVNPHHLRKDREYGAIFKEPMAMGNNSIFDNQLFTYQIRQFWIYCVITFRFTAWVEIWRMVSEQRGVTRVWK